MAGPDRSASAPVRHHRSGYIDHTVTILIVLVLAAVVGSRFWPLLPEIWSRFLLVTATVVVVGTAAVVAAGAWADGLPLPPERTDGGSVVRIPGPALRTAGVILWALALVFLAHAWIGEGLLWWAVAALGVLAGVVGTLLVASGERLVVEPGRVALETTLFGRRAHATECVREPTGPPEVEITSHTTGGAFGQPRVETHELRVDGEILYAGTRSRAEALRDALVGALAPAPGAPAGAASGPPAGAPSGAPAEAPAGGPNGAPTVAPPVAPAILLRLDAEPPYREPWKTRPPGWDDSAGDGVCAALSRRSGFRGLTVFDLGTGRVQWLRDPESAEDLAGPLGSELFERLEPLAEDEVRALGDEGIREVADAFLRSRGFAS